MIKFSQVNFRIYFLKPTGLGYSKYIIKNQRRTFPYNCIMEGTLS